MHSLWRQWYRMGLAILDGFAATTMKSELASYLVRYMKNLPIQIQLDFMVNFHTVWFCVHLKWMQARDDITRQPGFWSHHMPVRAYVMYFDMNGLIDNWKSMPEFQQYHILLESLPRETDPDKAVYNAIVRFGDSFLLLA